MVNWSGKKPSRTPVLIIVGMGAVVGVLRISDVIDPDNKFYEVLSLLGHLAFLVFMFLQWRIKKADENGG